MAAGIAYLTGKKIDFKSRYSTRSQKRFAKSKPASSTGGPV